MLSTKHLFLMPATDKMLDAAATEDWDALSSMLGGVYYAPNWSHFPETFAWVRDRVKAYPAEKGWWMYFILHGMDARVIGTCGYKGLPSADGAVEIGYEIAESYQNKGLATEAADVLVRNAFKSAEVQSVVAHTLAEENASVQVLRNLAFEYEGEDYDVSEGTIWKWRLRKQLA